MGTESLPTVNAALNLASGLLALAGWIAIRSGRKERHRAFMIAAVVCSSLFLASYLTYHSLHGSTRFSGEGIVRLLYLGILLTHSVAAAAVVPLVIVAVVRALRERFESHRKIARITLPIWLYVSVTGVVVYAMLYHL